MNSEPSPQGWRVVRAYWLGRIPYSDCWELQRSVVQAILAGEQPDSLLLLEHPHVFSMGRRGVPEHLLWGAAECSRRGVEVVWSDRGGDATYHGPGQLVGYPILDLRRVGTDLIHYIRGLEASLIAYLASLGIESMPGGRGLTGVWSGGEKVAAIGVKLNQRVTNHGFALNLTTDLEIFNQGIVPCGLDGKRATSVERLGGPIVATERAAGDYAPFFAGTFGVRVAWGEAAELHSLARVPADPITPSRVLRLMAPTEAAEA